LVDNDVLVANESLMGTEGSMSKTW